jgi:alpha-tubulin suppressor-like RCC1 family protein
VSFYKKPAIMKNTLLFISLFFIVNANAQCWEQIDAGGFFTFGIKDDGTLWRWGQSYTGDLYSGPYDFYAATPVQIGTDTDWAVVSAGNGHGMALKTDGTLWAWGRNDCGQLGNGTISVYPNPSPVQIGTDTDWAFISAGHWHSTAIKTNGTLWTWGYNHDGQLGNGTIDGGIATTIVPTQVGTDSNWKSIDASSMQSVAVKTDGTLWEWGHNVYLPMSNGSTLPVPYPIQIGNDNDWDQAAAGGYAISAIKTDGTLWSWGANNSGGVGNGTLTDVLEPQQISNEKWKSVNRGMNYFAGAIKADGTLWTWGYNDYGAVGNGVSIDAVGGGNNNMPQPFQIPIDGPWAFYQGGGNYSVALQEDGSLWVWGANWGSELGFNLEGNMVAEPVEVVAPCSLAGIENIQTRSIGVYPNPASDSINVVGEVDIKSLTVTDVTGKTILTQAGNATQLDVQALPAGVYFLKITATSGGFLQKFIKQ